MATPRVYKYKAFISYRHQDEKEAVAIQQFLEKFRLPTKLCRQYPDRPKRLGFVFRDATDLPPAELKQAISKALATSEYLVVLCSEWTNRPNEDGKRWIDEEVKAFLALDEQNKFRIIPVLLPREEMDVDTAYMPPVVVEHDILATDMARKGRQGAYFDVVAAMLNLDPVDLRDRVEAAERRQRILKRSLTGVLTAGMLAGGVFAWDFCVPKVRCYRDYVESYNIPVGIDELNEAEIAGLRRHYRITEQYYKVQKVESCNSAGSLIELTDEWASERPVAMRLTHDYIRNRVVLCDYLNKQGKVLSSLRYPLDDPNHELIAFVRKNEEGIERGSGFAASITNKNLGEKTNEATNQKSEITQMKVQRDSAGRVIAELFQNNYGYPRQNAEGVFGHRYERDSVGRVRKMRYLSSEGRDLPTRKGVAGYDLQLNEEGVVVQMTYVDEKGAPIMCPQGYAIKQFNRDALGNDLGCRYLDAQGNPCLNKDGYSGLMCTYDARGNLRQAMCLDTEGTLCFHKEGVAGVAHEYDVEEGNVVKSVYLGVDGKPCLNKYGVAGAVFQYNERGYEVKQNFIGVDGQSCLNKDGIAGSEHEFDEHGNLLKEVYLGIDGKPCMNKDGMAGFERVYDDYGNIGKETLFGVDGQPTFGKYGVAGREFEYDERGNVKKIMYLGVDGKPCLNVEGIAGWEMKRDGWGNEEKRMFFGVDGQPCLHKDGYAGFENEYDTRGNLVKLMYVGVDGKPCLISAGYAGYERECDDRGNETKVMYIGVDSQPCLSKDGYAGYVYEYDIYGNVVKLTYIGIDGKPRYCKDGYAGVDYTFDLRGNKLKETFLGLNGESNICKEGMAGVEYLYDERDHVVKSMNIGIDGKPCVNKDGFSGVAFEYDGRDNMVKKTYLGVDGLPVIFREGYAQEQYKYNAMGWLIWQGYGDIDGSLCVAAHGAAIVEFEYDARGNKVCEKFRDEKGQPKALVNGFAEVVYEYDIWGNETKRQAFDVDKKLCCWEANQAYGYLIEYNKYGRTRRIISLGPDGEPAEIHGVCYIQNEYDSLGNMTEKTFWGVNGEPRVYAKVNTKEGNTNIHRMCCEYDRYGRLVRNEWYGIDGKLCRRIENDCAVIEWNYNDVEKTVEISFYDEQRRPCKRKDGSEKEILKLDEYGNDVCTVFTDANNVPCMISDGYACVKREFDQYGRLVCQISLDSNMNPIPIPILGNVATIKSNYDARGFEVQRCFIGLDGEPVNCEFGFCYQDLEVDGLGNRTQVTYRDVAGNPCSLQDGTFRKVYVYAGFNTLQRTEYYDRDGNLLRSE